MADNSINKTDTAIALGRHMTVEFYDCDPKIIVNPEKVKQAFLKAAKDSGATVLDHSFHIFEPQGVSGVVIIAESHFAVHAWPEHDYAAVDLFTCSDDIDLKKAIQSLKISLAAEETIVSGDMHRGIISNNGVERLVPVCEDRTHIHTLSWKDKFKKSQAWGLLTSVDIYHCDPQKIRSADAIQQFVKELCVKIDMKRYKDCLTVHFGDEDRVAGFSMTQLIETSLISGHFAEESNAAYLDVFSCKFYEPRDVAEFAISFFKGSNYKMQVALRR
jgi:S-adenosylmethionine decarboxylase